MAGTPPLTAATLSADDTWTDPVEVTDSAVGISVTGTYASAITIQVKPMWRDLDIPWAYFDLIAGEKLIITSVMPGRVMVRAGFAPGDYSSGAALVAVYRGEDDAQRYVVTKAKYG